MSTCRCSCKERPRPGTSRLLEAGEQGLGLLEHDGAEDPDGTEEHDTNDEELQQVSRLTREVTATNSALRDHQTRGEQNKNSIGGNSVMTRPEGHNNSAMTKEIQPDLMTMRRAAASLLGKRQRGC